VAAARRAEEAAIRFEADRRRGESKLYQLGCDYAAFGGAPRMKRLRHRAEVLAQPACLACAQTQRAAHVVTAKAEQLRRRRRRPDGAAGRRAVKALLVAARQDCLGDLACDL